MILQLGVFSSNMGCCDSRPTRKVERDIKPAFEVASPDTASTLTCTSDLGGEPSLDSEASVLLNEPNWVSQIERTDYGVKTLVGSKYCPETPVCFVRLEVDRLIARAALVQALIDPQTRTSWDATVVQMEKLEKGQITGRGIIVP